MTDFNQEFFDSESFPRKTPSYDSCSTDEGYSTDEKPTFEDTKPFSKSENEIPILQSNHIIKISYSPITYTLTISIILLTLYTVTCQPFPWGHTFPPIFELFHLLFHFTHLASHEFNWFNIERLCIVYGTWLYWTGWLLSKLLFSEKLTVQPKYSTTLLFWCLMLERRNAWGIIVWEFISKLNQNLNNSQPSKLWETGSFRLLSFRIWCLLGTGSCWGLIYAGFAKLDGYAFKYLLQIHHLMKLLLVSTLGGFMIIIFWSFWTFQYKGILWQNELRKGIIVWYTEGIAHAAKVM